MTGFEVLPVSVGVVSRAWDEQSGVLTSAGSTLSGADSSGFRPAVQDAAASFVEAWSRHAQAAAEQAGQRADGLRETIRTYLTSDDHAGSQVILLMPYLQEGRR